MYLRSLSLLIFPDVSTSARLWISRTWALFHILYFLMFLSVRGCRFHVPERSFSSYILDFPPVRGCGFHVHALSFSSYISWCFYQCAVVDFLYLSSLSLLIFLDFSTSARSRISYACAFLLISYLVRISTSVFGRLYSYLCTVSKFHSAKLSALYYTVAFPAFFYLCIKWSFFPPVPRWWISCS